MCLFNIDWVTIGTGVPIVSLFPIYVSIVALASLQNLKQNHFFHKAFLYFFYEKLFIYVEAFLILPLFSLIKKYLLAVGELQFNPN